MNWVHQRIFALPAYFVGYYSAVLCIDCARLYRSLLRHVNHPGVRHVENIAHHWISMGVLAHTAGRLAQPVAGADINGAVRGGCAMEERLCALQCIL